MNQIIKELTLLREQGYDMHLWLEYVRKIPVGADVGYYFDGYIEVARTQFQKHNTINSVFIRVFDIETFKEESLYALREFNKDKYQNKRAKKDLKRVHTRYYTEIDYPKDFFSIYGLTKEGIFISDNLTDKITCNRLTIGTNVLTYKEAMSTLYSKIEQGIEYKYLDKEYTNTGIGYVSSLNLREYYAKRPKRTFNPTVFEVDSDSYGDEVHLIDGDLEEVWCVDQDYSVLNLYRDTVKGLDTYLDSLSVQHTAKEISNEKGLLKYADLVTSADFNYLELLREGKSLEHIVYQVQGQGVIQLTYTAPSICNDIRLFPDSYLSQYVQIHLELTDYLQILPYYVTKITYDKGILEVFILCKVSLATSGEVMRELPLHLLANQIGYEESVLILNLPYCNLYFSGTLLHCLRKDYDLDKILGSEIVDYSPKSKKYKRMWED